MNVKEIYNLLHSMPEEGMQEFKTSEYLAKQLEILGYKVTRNIGITGVVGTYNTGVPGPTLAIRADMDALKHLISGEIKFIHSCGHDAHAAMVLVAASRLINNVKKGTLKIVFQPGEETLLGAQAMIKDGLLEDIDIMLGLHLRPIQDASMGQASPGVYHAASAVLDVTIQGLTAHGARPHLGINAIDAAALAILAVNSIRTNPIIACSAKVTAINAGGAASNAIPNKATLVLDVRAQTNAAMQDLQAKIKAAITAAAATIGATAEVTIRGEVPAAELDDTLTNEVAEVIEEVLGAENLIPRLQNPGGEDFHYFAVKKPGLKAAYFGLGCDLEPGLHDPNMDFNKDALENGVNILTKMVLKKLG